MSEVGLFEAIHTARALRRLKPDPVPDEMITKLLDAAIRAPSASNAQNWVFVAVKDAGRRARLGQVYLKAWDMMGKMYSNRQPAPHQSEKGYKRMMGSADYLAHHLHEVPLLIIAGLMTPAVAFQPPAEYADRVNSAAPRLAGSSIYPAVQNILLACRGLGLGSVLTTIHSYFNDDVREALGLPPEFVTYAMLPVGYPMEGYGHGPVKRRPLSEVAFLDRWGNNWRA